MTKRIIIKTDQDAVNYLGNDPSNGTGMVIVKNCGRCSGTGFWSKGHRVANGKCFRCSGTGQPKEYTLVEHARRERRRELRQKASRLRSEALVAACAERIAKEEARREAREAERAADLAAKRAAEAAQSDHVGTVRERVTVDVTVIVAKVRYGNYGPSTWLLMKDESGNVITWNASGERTLERGDKITLTATVKAHSMWNDTRQTQVTRGKLAA